MTRYAENLIGKWEDDQFEPQRLAVQNTYNTNWEALTNDFNNLKDQLERNQKLAQLEYGGQIGDIQNNAYDRTSQYYQNLANRGLSSSGMVDQLSRANTEATGQEVDKALEGLLSVTSEGVKALSDAGHNLALEQQDLNRGLADDLGAISDAEAANAQAYANLVASITQSADQRRASYGGGSKDEDEEYDEIYQLITIKDIMNNPETSDDDKYFELVKDAAVTPEQAEKILSSYNYNKISDELSKAQSTYNENTRNLKAYNPVAEGSNPVTNALVMVNPVTATARWGIGLPIVKHSVKSSEKNLNKLQKDIEKYTYEDLKDIMGY